jgi:hypothetical protein
MVVVVEEEEEKQGQNPHGAEGMKGRKEKIVGKEDIRLRGEEGGLGTTDSRWI